MDEMRISLKERLLAYVVKTPGKPMSRYVVDAGVSNMSYGLELLRKLADENRIVLREKVMDGTRLRIKTCWPV